MLGSLGAPHDPALDPALRAAVRAIAVAWAQRVAAPGLAFQAEDEPAELLGGHEGPVLLVAPDVPRLDDDLAAMALADLAAGCALAFAPATDSKPYLLAFPAPRPELLALLAAPDRRRDVIFAEATKLGEVGLLRSERRVVTPADARALALDPLAPAELCELARRAHAP